MLVQYVLHKVSVLLCATILLLPQLAWLGNGDRRLVRYTLMGYVVCGLIALALLLLCTWGRVQELLLRIMGHFSKTEKWQGHLTQLYRQSRRVLRDQRRLAEAVALDVGKLGCLYTVAYVSLRLLGVAALTYPQALLLMALTNLIAGAVPNVAGVGPTEFAFLLSFSGYTSAASSALALYRLTTYFFPFLVSVPVVLLAQRRAVKETC
jgi:hypothetical protein